MILGVVKVVTQGQAISRRVVPPGVAAEIQEAAVPKTPKKPRTGTAYENAFSSTLNYAGHSGESLDIIAVAATYRFSNGPVKSAGVIDALMELKNTGNYAESEVPLFYTTLDFLRNKVNGAYKEAMELYKDAPRVLGIKPATPAAQTAE